MGLFEDYENYLVKYQKTYGEKTVVLYQNGMFFETYGVDNEKEKIGLVKEVSDMLNIQLTRRNKAILDNDRSNFLLAGFPLNQLDRYLLILTEENQYVVVVVEQVTPPPNPQRAVTNIISPGTNLNYLSQHGGNYLVSIYIENEGKKIHQIKPVEMQTIGLSAIDVSTGQSVVYEVCNLLDDQNRAIDEAYRFLQTFQPKEILINTRQCSMSSEELMAHFDLSQGHCLFHYQADNVPVEYYKLSYQNDFLGKIFKQTSLLKPIEFINLERYPTATISYMLLLSFCYQQKETIIEQIERPNIWNNAHYMILDNNCINQLNLVSTAGGGGNGGGHKLSSVFNLVDHTSTPMGKRLLKEKLLLPLINLNEIIQRYDALEYFRQELTTTNSNLEYKCIQGHQRLYLFQAYEAYLKQISDIERLQRKICLCILQPCEFNRLDLSYQSILKIIDLLTLTTSTIVSQHLLPSNLQEHLSSYIDYYQQILDLNETAKYNLTNIEGSFFKRGFNEDIDRIQERITESHQYFQELTAQMSHIVSGSADKAVVQYQYTEDYGYHLEITTNRWKTFEANYKTSMNFKIGTQTYVVARSQMEVINNRTGKTCKVISPEIKQISKLLLLNKSLLLQKVTEVYRGFLKQTYDQFSLIMKQLVIFIGLVDFYKSGAKASLLYNYCRPSLIGDKDVHLRATQLRHPLIERLQEAHQYVPQDIYFDIEQQGILLFGVNAVGKSSLMRAIGIATIMAQAGLYVPAQRFILRPYHSIMTRIIGNDNLFKGLSSFAVEMCELRGILKRANSESLILGDEICHGTETFSGVSLVASAIISLINLGANFLFATHLHQLSQITRITELEALRMYHLKVKFDEKSGNLIYDRRLEEGAGHPVYGLEVAKAMDLDRTFIDLANTIRRELMNVDQLLQPKKSRYNSQVYLDRCGICGNPAELTHHINFQSDADRHGYIDNLPKNHRSNLVPLCKTCHDLVHNGQNGQYHYEIKGYIMTSNGSQLNYEKIENSSVPVPPISPVSSPAISTSSSPQPKKHKLKLR